MKKLFPILAALALFSSACQMGSAAEPTPISLPTAFPTNTPASLNPTAEASGPAAPGEERASPVDGMIQVYIPEGSFRMGGMDPRASGDEQPDHNVTLHAYWIDKLEVTVGMYTLCTQAGVCEPPQAFNSATNPQYFTSPDFKDYPVIYVTWGMADTYCKWAGRRLPTEAEWERAARGNDFRTFPWGDQRPDNSLANFNSNVGDVTRVGSFPAGASPFGVLDMAGNVWEWVQDFYDSEYYSSGINLNPTGPVARSAYFFRVARGGSYKDAEVDIRVANRASVLGPNPNADLDSPEYFGVADASIGFRCVSDN